MKLQNFTFLFNSFIFNAQHKACIKVLSNLHAIKVSPSTRAKNSLSLAMKNVCQEGKKSASK